MAPNWRSQGFLTLKSRLPVPGASCTRPWRQAEAEQLQCRRRTHPSHAPSTPAQRGHATGSTLASPQAGDPALQPSPLLRGHRGASRCALASGAAAELRFGARASRGPLGAARPLVGLQVVRTRGHAASGAPSAARALTRCLPGLWPRVAHSAPQLRLGRRRVPPARTRSADPRGCLQSAERRRDGASLRPALDPRGAALRTVTTSQV